MPKHKQDLEYNVQILPQTVGRYIFSYLDVNTFYVSHRESGQGVEMPVSDFEDMLANYHAENF